MCHLQSGKTGQSSIKPNICAKSSTSTSTSKLRILGALCPYPPLESTSLQVLSATRFLLSSLQKPLVWLMRALLMLAAFVGIFLPRAENDSEVSPVYDVCVKILGCCNIFCVANLVKMLAAKQMASHFHAKTHFMKMREALKKVSEPARRGGQLGSQTCLTAPGSLNEYVAPLYTSHVLVPPVAGRQLLQFPASLSDCPCAANLPVLALTAPPLHAGVLHSGPF